MRKKLKPYVLLIPQIVLSIIFLIGLVIGIIQSLGVIPVFGLTEPTLKYYKEVLTKPDFITSVIFSLKIAFISATVSTVAGVLICALLVATDKVQGIMMRIIQLPIIVPHVVVALFMVNIFSQNGLIARVIYALGMVTEQQEFPLLIYDSKGVGIILSYLWKEIPFIIYFVVSLMANINKNLGEAAVNLGAGRIKSFIKITLPLCGHTILSGFLIVFVFALGAYELPLILGATTPRALPILAYIQYTYPDLTHLPYAMALNGIIIIISVISAYLYFVLMNKNIMKLTKKGDGINE